MTNFVGFAIAALSIVLPIIAPNFSIHDLLPINRLPQSDVQLPQLPPAPAKAQAELPPAHTVKARTFDLPVNMDANFRSMTTEISIYRRTPETPWALRIASAV